MPLAAPMLRQRITTAIMVLLVLLPGLWLLPNAWWAVLSAAVIAIGAWEWAGLAAFSPGYRLLFAGLVAASCLLLLPLTGGEPAPWMTAIWAGACVFWVALALPWIVRQRHWRRPLVLAIAGWLVLVPAWLAVVFFQRMPLLLLAVMAVIWVADTAAYFVGRRFGRRRLAPLVSPGKTWEGVIGACAAVLLYWALLTLPAYSLMPDLGQWRVLLTFVVMTGLGILGDLFESWMKREAGVKDSGTVLPGHGGILDRIDALVAALPFAALASVLLWHP